MKKLLCTILLCFALANSSEPEVSLGLSGGQHSGFLNISARVWNGDWGLQLGAFPMFDFQETETNRFILSNIQFLHRTKDSHGTSTAAYQGTDLFQYVGGSLIYWDSFIFSDAQWTWFAGAGVGVESRWEKWRIATSIGYGISGSVQRESPGLWKLPEDEPMILPTMDITISYQVF